MNITDIKMSTRLRKALGFYFKYNKLENPTLDDLRKIRTEDFYRYRNVGKATQKEFEILLNKGFVTHYKSSKLVTSKRFRDLNNIRNDENITHCYIINRGSYYADNHCGYTSFLLKAGIYEKLDAINSAESCDELTLIPIVPKDHNEMIQLEIDRLKKRFIQASS